MSFWKSFFAAMAASKIREKKKEEQERVRKEQERLNNSQKLLKMQMDFYTYLGQINCKNVSFKEIVSDSDIDNDNVSSFDIMRTEQLFNGYKQQLKQYMSYGGNPIYICDSECDTEKMDLYIEIVKRLKDYGWLDKQEQYVKYADDTYWLDFDLENAKKDRHRIEVQIPAILNAKGNELTKVLKKMWIMILFRMNHI